MIEYVLAHNPDDRVLKKACDILKNGGLVCLPSDTNWILIADPYHKDAMEKLYKIKEENPHKHFSLICNSISMASDVALIDNSCFRILKRVIPGHYTFIFEATKKMAKVIKATKTDKEIGLRFVPSPLIDKLITMLGDVVISSNIPKKVLNIGDEEVVYSYMIEESPLGHMINLIIDPGEFEFAGESTIVSFINGTPEVLRVGVGDINLIL
jgi:tRNA threonylcarbamoyl adenosine modification protein (Sua5/YciO/YrdC/YwlC family)